MGRPCPMKLTSRTCRWPIGDPKRGDFCFVSRFVFLKRIMHNPGLPPVDREYAYWPFTLADQHGQSRKPSRSRPTNQSAKVAGLALVAM
jgi:hypothetical protein